MNRIELERKGKKEYETSNETEKGGETREERIGVNMGETRAKPKRQKTQNEDPASRTLEASDKFCGCSYGSGWSWSAHALCMACAICGVYLSVFLVSEPEQIAWDQWCPLHVRFK